MVDMQKTLGFYISCGQVAEAGVALNMMIIVTPTLLIADLLDKVETHLVA